MTGYTKGPCRPRKSGRQGMKRFMGVALAVVGLFGLAAFITAAIASIAKDGPDLSHVVFFAGLLFGLLAAVKK